MSCFLCKWIGEGIPKALESHRTTVYKREPTVAFGLKTDSGRKTFAHLKKEIGDVPFSLRQFPDETKARVGLAECARVGLITPYHVLYEKEGADVAHLIMTVLLMPTGPLKITGIAWDPELVKSEKELKDEGIKELLKQPIRSNSKAAKKKKVLLYTIACIITAQRSHYYIIQFLQKKAAEAEGTTAWFDGWWKETWIKQHLFTQAYLIKV